ncbi:hypothetical protein JTE90_021663 [Oedothorax gibbosus]|uniref:Neurogenic mastermind-like N-terminal domain-containing protein n=1 Tax=Oedothorax gibbosus TaxID=931172 RepID=A0AAV6VRA8_9ARAC|nr:hypothetical protein JTE90_021663 [Oedothorax gibbosus]
MCAQSNTPSSSAKQIGPSDNVHLAHPTVVAPHPASNIARHELPEWCQPGTGDLLYHQSHTLDIASYPPSGDLLPSKRQTVVDRLRRRLEAYRRHQGSCLPRYDQAASGQYDIQRMETMQLKQRFLENKAKKTRRNDNRTTNGGETQPRNAVLRPTAFVASTCGC